MTQYPTINDGDQLSASAFTKTFQNLMAINLAHGKGVVSGLVISPGGSPGTVAVTAGSFVAQVFDSTASSFVVTIGNSASSFLWIQADDDATTAPTSELSGTDPGSIWVCLGHVASDGSGVVTCTDAGRTSFGSADVESRAASLLPLLIAGGLGSAAKVVTASSWTLNATEASVGALFVTGTPGVSRNVVVPAIQGKAFDVVNRSDSSIVVKTPSGAGVTIATLKAARVIGDGTDVIRLTADA